MSQEPPFDELDTPRTEADVTSQTRFGPRPVPEGHHHPSERPEPRRIPPHGDVSPDGLRAYPRPSRLAKWVVWGGTGIAAAALTAGTVIAARHLSDLISGRDDDRPRPPRPTRHRRDPQPPAPRFAAPPAQVPQAPRPRPAQPQPARRNLMEEIEANTATLTSSVDNVVKSVTAAVAGFHGVASQASAIMREFGDAADLVRDILDRREPEGDATREANAETGPADHDPRTHRL
ncbi:hypothetical protein ACHFJ0_07125 [Paracoccus sp. NGMCC 1.201697]|uniref:Uncharacterized protein n=1 Tax=Paracoccus broussonetiae subsp. drimophilus TaxID=3373869 RepID=A0ABW7LIP4_9RHOB